MRHRHKGNVMYRARVSAGLFFVCVVMGAGQARAQDAQDAQGDTPLWSFAKHPHPPYKTMTKAEKARMDPLLFDGQEGPAPCDEIIRTSYAIYRDRYPAFETQTASLTPAARLRLWRMHVFVREPSYIYLCILDDLREKIFALVKTTDMDPQFYFCGHYSRPPASADEKAFALLVDEHVSYARTGKYFAARNLTTSFDDVAQIKINPDIAYYFYKIAQPFYPLESWDGFIAAHRSYYGGLLSAERKAQVDRYAAERNYQAVLSSSKACS